MVPYVDIIGLCHCIAILWEFYVAALPFQAHANYGTCQYTLIPIEVQLKFWKLTLYILYKNKGIRFSQFTKIPTPFPD